MLDLAADGAPEPVVRWTSFKASLDLYQGALQQKDCYTKAFFEQVGRSERYDTKKLQAVIDAIVGACTAMATQMLTT